jgi:hypothetical protein
VDDSKKVKANFAFLVNPFMVDVINDGFPIPKILLTGTSAAWTEVLESRENGGLQKMTQVSVCNRILKRVPESKFL